ncbi:post-transcriptional regulator [Bacillus sp. CGMCC 1.16607]|uniref:post-transcriptional regulator n=1 Tax=Bacillus sp. CGMCC 1.16607 TaxID=3351842 RepID=UPI0036306CBD
MNKGHLYDHFQIQVQPALQSKIEEFRLLGYGTVSESQLWIFLTMKKWKRPKEDIRLYEVVQEILSLDLGEFMNYQTVEALKSSQFSFQNEEDWKELMK